MKKKSVDTKVLEHLFPSLKGFFPSVHFIKPNGSAFYVFYKANNAQVKEVEQWKEGISTEALNQ